MDRHWWIRRRRTRRTRLRAVMTGTARAGQGVHREVGSEGSCSPRLDDWEADKRACRVGSRRDGRALHAHPDTRT